MSLTRQVHADDILKLQFLILQIIITDYELVGILVERKLFGPSFKNYIRKHALKDMPRFRYIATLYNTETDTMERIEKEVLPQRVFVRNEGDVVTLICLEAITNAEELKKFHRLVLVKRGLERYFAEHCSKVDISSDGVRIANHAKFKNHVYSVRFGSRFIYFCRVYTPTIKMPKPHLRIKVARMMAQIVDEVNQDPDLTLRNIIADQVERRMLRGMRASTAKDACETCLGSVRNRKHADWTYNEGINHPLRDEEMMREAARNLHTGLVHLQGVNAYSPLNDVEAPFSIIWSLPLDPFHLIHEGLTKLMVSRLFEQCTAQENQNVLKAWNNAYSKVQVCSEMARRARNVDTGQMKGSELKTVLYVGFPMLLKLMQLPVLTRKQWPHASMCASIYLFLCRAMDMPNRRYALVKEALAQIGESMASLSDRMYYYFGKGFCEGETESVATKRHTPNTHSFYHLHLHREMTGIPLWEFSAEPFEAAYGHMNRAFVPGTRNIPKQIAQRSFMRWLHTDTGGKRTGLTVTPLQESKRKTRDDLVFTKTGKLLQVFETVDKHIWNAIEIKVKPFEVDIEGVRLPWSLVGVHEFEAFGEDVIRVTRKEIAGKVIFCGSQVNEWYTEWFQSKLT